MINCQYQEVSLIKCLKINCILETIRTTDTKFANKGCKWKIPANNFFFLSGFSSQTLTIHRTAGEGSGPSFIPLYHFHPLTSIETFIYFMLDDYHVFLIATLAFTKLLLDEIYHLIELPFEWLIDDAVFVCLLDKLILGFYYSDLTL